MTQPELFKDIAQEPRPRRLPWASFPGRFLRFKVAYEDVIFGALSLVLVVLAGFCLGVERGRQIGVAPLVSQVPTEQPPVGLAAAAVERALPVIPASVPARRTDEGAGIGSYCIQLASYAGPAAAKAEADRLRRRGLQAQVIPQGRYHELRAVGFRSWSEAKKSLTELRKTYRDAFIKSLSSARGSDGKAD